MYIYVDMCVGEGLYHINLYNKYLYSGMNCGSRNLRTLECCAA